MKKFRSILCVSLALLLLLSLFSCSSRKEATDSMALSPEMEEIKSEAVMDSANLNGSLSFTESPDVSESVTQGESDERKIIERLHLSLQTKEFELLLQNVETQVSLLGGYVEASEVRGRAEESKQNRYAYLTLRIPASNSGVFTSFVSEQAVVINKTGSTEDVTLSYVDTESRIKALELEKEALEEILKKAENVTDIMNIRKNLTDVIYEIESAKSRLRTYDNLVSYSTVTLSIQEVERTAVVEEQGVFEEIGTNLKNNFEDVWNGIVSAFVFLVSSIPYLIPILIVLVLLVAVVKAKRKKKAKKPVSEENK